MFIDPPSPFAPIEEWREFLVEMESIMDPSSYAAADIADQIEQARRHITAYDQGLREWDLWRLAGATSDNAH